MSEITPWWQYESALAAVGFEPSSGIARDLLRGPHDKRIGLFVTQLNKNGSSSANGPVYDLNAGELTIGCVSPRGHADNRGVSDWVFSGNISYMPLVNSTGWGVALDGIKLDGQSIDLGQSPPTAFIRSPDTAISMSETLANLTMASVPGSNYVTPLGDDPASAGYHVPCNTTSNLTFTLGGKDYDLPSRFCIKSLNVSDPSSPCMALVAPVKEDAMA